MEASAKAYILKNIVEIACSPSNGEYQNMWNLSASDLQSFLEDSELNVNDESMTFWIIIRLGFYSRTDCGETCYEELFFSICYVEQCLAIN